MNMDLATLSPISAVFGALIGGTTSLLAAVCTQRRMDRLRQIAAEMVRREAVYADFVAHASNVLLQAYVHDDIVLTGDEHRLMAVVIPMRFFAPPCVTEAAERVLKTVAEIALQPSVELRMLMRGAVQRPRARSAAQLQHRVQGGFGRGAARCSVKAVTTRPE